MELTNREWKEFKLTDLFDFVKGDQNNMSSIKTGSIPLVSAKKSDNGYKDFALKSKKLYQENSLTLNNDGDGGAGIAYYQPTNYLLDSHVTALYPKDKLNKFTLLYISRCITAQRDKFGHGYSINNQRLKVFKLMLPVNSQGNPDYEFMESYMKQKETELLKVYKNHLVRLKPSEKVNVEVEWKEFKIGTVFNVSTGALLPKDLLKKGKTARITATDNNNGVFDFYENVKHKNYRVLTNFISISFLGSVFYHPYTASLDMKIHAVQIPNLELNRYVAEFLVLCFKRMASGFSYGDQLSSTDLPKKRILLPTNDKGQPDFVYMESYMKALEYEKLKQYLDYKKLNTNNEHSSSANIGFAKERVKWL